MWFCEPQTTHLVPVLSELTKVEDSCCGDILIVICFFSIIIVLKKEEKKEEKIKAETFMVDYIVTWKKLKW